MDLTNQKETAKAYRLEAYFREPYPVYVDGKLVATCESSEAALAEMNRLYSGSEDDVLKALAATV